MSTAHPSPDPAAVLAQALGSDAQRPQPWPAPPLATLAPHFPELTLEALIGQGGMAAVYRAGQTRTGRAVALKVLRPDHAQQSEFVARFLREARALAALNHPHVLTVLDFGERGGFCYLLTEFVDGANLRQLMELGRLSPAEVLRLVPQICAGLQFAHEHGIVHRDIKPENVLVDRHGQVKLADFGLAKLLHTEGEATLTRPSMVFGTPHYMAPEQWRGSGAVDHRADIYSLGVLLYELLTGRLPVGTYDPPSKCVAVSPGIDQVVHKSLEHEPARRYQDVGAVRRDVEREADAPAAPAPAPAQGRRLLWIGATLLVAATLGLLAFAGHAVFQLQLQRREAVERATQVEMLGAIRAQVEAGHAWTGSLPEFVPAQARTLAPAWIAALSAAWTLGTAGVVSLLGILAGRHLAAAAKGWRLAAAFLAWSPALLLVDASLIAIAVNSHAGATLGSLLVLVALATHAAWGWWQWQRPVVATAPGGGLRGGLLAASLLLIATVAAALCLPRATGTAARQPLVVRKTDDLQSQSPATVLALLGPPQRIRAFGGGMTWAYHGLDGQLVQDALMFDRERVLQVRTGPGLVAGEVPELGPYLGQSTADLERQRGPAVQSDDAAGGQQLRFADGLRVRAWHGVVVDVTR